MDVQYLNILWVYWIHEGQQEQEDQRSLWNETKTVVMNSTNLLHPLSLVETMSSLATLAIGSVVPCSKASFKINLNSKQNLKCLRLKQKLTNKKTQAAFWPKSTLAFSMSDIKSMSPSYIKAIQSESLTKDYRLSLDYLRTVNRVHLNKIILVPQKSFTFLGRLLKGLLLKHVKWFVSLV